MKFRQARSCVSPTCLVHSKFSDIKNSIRQRACGRKRHFTLTYSIASVNSDYMRTDPNGRTVGRGRGEWVSVLWSGNWQNGGRRWFARDNLQKGGMISNFPFVVDEGSKEHYRKFFKSGFYKGKLTIGEIASKDIYNFTIWSTTSSTQVKLCMLIGNSKSHCFSILNISENKCFFSRCIVTWTAFKNGFQSDMHACLVNMFWEWVALLPELLYHNASLHIIWWSFTLFGSRKYTFPLFKISGNSKRERVSKTSGEDQTQPLIFILREENHLERFFAQPQH